MHVRCPHCHHAIEIIQDDSLTNMLCPSCGSGFYLVGRDETTASHPGSVRKIAHFQLLERLGSGHFGTVWKARDTDLDRLVAVKIPRRKQLTEAEIGFFFREARAAAQVRHPNIVSVLEIGRHGDEAFIVSDYIDGATLKDWAKVKRPSLDQAVKLCRDLAEAIHHAHEVGVIHRDLKPTNVIIDAEGRPYIMDFGLAKREQGEITMTVDGQVLGTPAYMSPEQAKGDAHQADCRSDVYSLGVILFELLTGRLPFRGENRMLLVEIANDNPPPPSEFNQSVPSELDAICLKCLEKEPDRRYITAQQLADDLDGYLNRLPITALADRTPRVLIVDDSMEDLEALRLVFDRAGYRTSIASSGSNALTMIVEDRPHIVITDLEMPEIDGLELIRRITETCPRVPVILMAECGNEDIALKALRLGAASYIPKMNLRSDLLDTVREVLAVKGMHAPQPEGE